MHSEASRYPMLPEHARGRYRVVAGVAAVAAMVVAVALTMLAGYQLSTAFWLLAVLAVVADTRPFIPSGQRRLPVRPSVCFTFAILLTSGLGLTIVVQAFAVAATAWRERPTAGRAALDLGQYALAFGAADLLLRAGQLRPFPPEQPFGVETVAGLALAATGWFLVRYAATAASDRLRLGAGWRSGPGRNLCWDALSYGALLLVSPILAAGAAASPALLPLTVVPLYAVHRLAKLAEEQAGLTRRDPLTGLANRKALVDEIAHSMRERRCRSRGETHGRLALLLLDLDRFKNVNDALGHELGDRLLVEVGRRLTSQVGPHDLVARLGGDEFAVLARRVSGTADACAVATKLSEVLAEPVSLDGLAVDVGGAIGVAVCPEHGDDTDVLLRHADVAMYDAKHRAAAVAVYTPESDHHSAERLALLADLREMLRAPDPVGLEMHYQPQIEIETGEVVGVEALLRWCHPTHGLVNPDFLIKTAEHTTVMRLLTLWVVDEVVEQVAKWAAAGVQLRASINVSVRDLQTSEVAERIAHQLGAFEIPADWLQLEITEGALMADPRRVLATMAALDRLGVAISLDDFGTGYSSLQHLRRLPLAEVKVDRSFVLGMTQDPDDASIVTSIIELAGALGLRVVAEGVEDERTWRQLAGAGCHIAQGWFYARPMPADELSSWLARYQPLAAAPLAGRAKHRGT